MLVPLRQASNRECRTEAPGHEMPDLAHGNPGDHRNLTDGVSELRVDAGPGYRVYYMQRGTDLIVLLGGGDKASQHRDIERAVELASNL